MAGFNTCQEGHEKKLLIKPARGSKCKHMELLYNHQDNPYNDAGLFVGHIDHTPN